MYRYGEDDGKVDLSCITTGLLDRHRNQEESGDSL